MNDHFIINDSVLDDLNSQITIYYSYPIDTKPRYLSFSLDSFYSFLQENSLEYSRASDEAKKQIERDFIISEGGVSETIQG